MHKTMKLAVTAFATVMLVAGPAVAVSNANTTTSLKANKTTVQAGNKVEFTIKLKSKKDKCVKNMEVDFYRNGVFQDTFITGNGGGFTFNRFPNTSGNFRAVFGGAKVGQHPHRVNCKPSASDIVHITVKQ